eukprot:jgi/Ulvmu1/4441/UM002_0166.1
MRFYCDYCDSHLTHDSPSVRKQHNAGFKHKANVRAYYLQFEQQETEDMLEKKMAANMALALQHGPGFAGPGMPGGIPRPRAGLVRPQAGMPPAGMPPAGLGPPMAGMRPAPAMPPPGMAPGMAPPGPGGAPHHHQGSYGHQ